MGACHENALHLLDPQLSNNGALVSKLVALGELSEKGVLCFQDVQTRSSLCKLITTLSWVQQQLPNFETLRNECDAEWFMILPRLIWLCYLSAPSCYSPLLSQILPHRFLANTSEPDLELQGLIEKFEYARQHLSAEVGEIAALSQLVQRAVQGEPTQGCGEAQAAVEEFMLMLESWSMQLQRHEPKKWNGCTSVVMRCLSGQMTRINATQQPQEDICVDGEKATLGLDHGLHQHEA